MYLSAFSAETKGFRSGRQIPVPVVFVFPTRLESSRLHWHTRSEGSLARPSQSHRADVLFSQWCSGTPAQCPRRKTAYVATNCGP